MDPGLGSRATTTVFSGRFPERAVPVAEVKRGRGGSAKRASGYAMCTMSVEEEVIQSHGWSQERHRRVKPWAGNRRGCRNQNQKKYAIERIH